MFRLLFNLIPLQARVYYLKKRGITLGTRLKGDRRIYLYMLGYFFVEVLYINDLTANPAEAAYIVRGLTQTNLNDYLEQEFQSKHRSKLVTNKTLSEDILK